mgnify:CR=1
MTDLLKHQAQQGAHIMATPQTRERVIELFKQQVGVDPVGRPEMEKIIDEILKRTNENIKARQL